MTDRRPHATTSRGGHHLPVELDERLLLCLQVRLPGPGVPDLDPKIRTDDDALAGQARVLAQIRRDRDPALPVGGVVRYEYKTPDGRELMYLIPIRKKTLLLDFAASEAKFGTLSARVESSLSSIRIRP